MDNSGRMEVVVSNDLETRSYLTPYGAKLRVNVGDHVNIGDKITKGSIDPKELLNVADTEAVENYIIKEVQKVYRIQGIEISDKHIEIIVKQMLKKIRIVEGGDTGTLPGTHVNVTQFTELNREALKEGKHPAVGRPILLGITKASLETDSFLSAASFQETTKILTDASIKGKKDMLKGLKENFYGELEGESERLNSHLTPKDCETFYLQYKGESSNTTRDRMVKTLTDIMSKEDHHSVLAVSHGGACFNFLRAFQDPMEELKKGFGNCCIFIYEFDNGTFTLKDVIRHQI